MRFTVYACMYSYNLCKASNMNKLRAANNLSSASLQRRKQWRRAHLCAPTAYRRSREYTPGRRSRTLDARVSLLVLISHSAKTQAESEADECECE